jgi:hypothetical protein
MLPTKEVLENIVANLQEKMRIQDWDITLDYIDQYKMKHVFDADHLDTAMMCERYRLRKEALIYVNIDHSANEDQWYENIVHELFHIVTGELSDIAEDLMDETNASEMLKRYKTQTTETMVTNLSKIFVSLYPECKHVEGGNDNGQNRIQVQQESMVEGGRALES